MLRPVLRACIAKQVNIARANFLLRNALRVPVLELDATEIRAGVSTEAPGVMRCFAFLQTSVWSYNEARQAWEPVVEPLQTLAHLDVNSHARARGGVLPGTWIKLTSTQVQHTWLACCRNVVECSMR